MTSYQKGSKVDDHLTLKYPLNTDESIMAKINQLSPDQAQKIAAGQVVERPSNVVKELVENAIDAQAAHIRIIIKDGGKELIRIVDNGTGMDRQDAKNCFLKHATSKIRSIDELASLTSYGFRGEALPSIAAISKVSLKTKEHDATEGTEIIAQDGKMSAQSVATPAGTDICVQELFYNVPARLKFVKKKETETRHIIQTIKAFCLAYPQLHIELNADGKNILNCPPQQESIGRFAQLWDGTTAKHMLSVDATNSAKGISIHGAISDHQWFRYDRSGIFFIVNNRWVTNQSLGRALLRGYTNVLPHGRFPMACISIMINPALIDINSHPKKEEIIFANPRTVEQLISSCVQQALEKNLSKQIKKEVSFAPQAQSQNQSFASFTPASYTNLQEAVKPQAANIEPDFTHVSAPAMPSAPAPVAASQQNIASQQQPMPILEEESREYTIVGQLHKTYIIVQKDDGVSFVDQHAAHERILYELFANRFESVPTINLMFPQIVTVSAQDLELLEPHISLLQEHGITAETFGKDQLIIQSAPVHLKNAQFSELIHQLIGWIAELGNVDKTDLHKKLHDKLRAQMACKAAVKAGDTLTHEQMQELIDDLSKTNNRLTCPHGRPTGWFISLHEIEKKVQRRL